MTPKSYTELFAKIIELMLALKVTNIYELPGCYALQVDEKWRFALNGHKQSIMDGDTEVPCYHACVWRGDFMVGIVGPYEGVLLAGAEQDFMEALDKRIAESEVLT